MPDLACKIKGLIALKSGRPDLDHKIEGLSSGVNLPCLDCKIKGLSISKNSLLKALVIEHSEL